MHRTHHRALLTMTAGIATLALGAAPALAGSDGCSDDEDCATGPTPPAVFQPSPVPVAPQPAADSGPAAEDVARTPRRSRSHRGHRVRSVTVGTRTTVPRGAVAAGAGGTAPSSPDDVLVLLAAGALVLVASGGRLVAVSRGAAS